MLSDLCVASPLLPLLVQPLHNLIKENVVCLNNNDLKLHYVSTCSCFPLRLCRSGRSARRPRSPPCLWAGHAGCIPGSWSACGWSHSPASAPLTVLQSPASNTKIWQHETRTHTHQKKPLTFFTDNLPEFLL